MKRRKYEKVCRFCGAEYVTYSRRQTACSDYCRKMLNDEKRSEIETVIEMSKRPRLNIDIICLAATDLGMSYGYLRAKLDSKEITVDEVCDAALRRKAAIIEENKAARRLRSLEDSNEMGDMNEY